MAPDKIFSNKYRLNKPAGSDNKQNKNIMICTKVQMRIRKVHQGHGFSWSKAIIYCTRQLFTWLRKYQLTHFVACKKNMWIDRIPVYDMYRFSSRQNSQKRSFCYDCPQKKFLF